ncbi:hypothetical protein K474DRAFT_1668251 [Panus rudis PR-1116 ss-1]|nr:hypothetical protein K474DRAFT_1668251 [Panus rudis PR-1116 ss-1]
MASLLTRFLLRDLSTLSPQATYDTNHVIGIASLLCAGLISGLAVFFVFVIVSIRSPTYHNTHVVPYFVSLLISNILQAAGTSMNARWVLERMVVAGGYCSFQGGLKQAGNIGMALWSFVLAAHLFNLLFLRWKSTKVGLWATLAGGWFAIIFIVAIVPIPIQATKKRGPYFGPSGFWCWITPAYPQEQIFLEYFFEYVSAALSFVLYTAILLCVRGNVVKSGGRWRFRFVPHGESWQLAVSRDLIDSSVKRVVARVVAYSILLLPVSLARLIEFGGHKVPFWATILADTIFNLQGLVNVMLLLLTRRFIPDTASLPTFNTPRKNIDLTSSEAVGITPFILPPKPEETHTELTRSDSMASTDSVDSTAPMIRLPRPSRWSIRPSSWRFSRSV